MNDLRNLFPNGEVPSELYSMQEDTALTPMINEMVERIYGAQNEISSNSALPNMQRPESTYQVAGNLLSAAMENTLQAMPQNGKDALALINDLSFSFQRVEDTYKHPSPEITSPVSNIDRTFMQSHDIEKVRHDFPVLQTKVHGKPLVWLDNAATTQKPQVVIDTIRKYYEFENSNIHRGNHYLSMKATEMYENVRKKVARFIHADSEKEIIFVRGATEGINLVAATFGKKFINRGDEIVITMIEHHSNILPWQVLCEERGAKLCVVPINKNADIVLDEYVKLVSSKTKLVAMAHVSNALGTVLPVEIMTQIAHQFGAYVLIDGAQSVPHFEVNVAAIDCDFYVFSGHKLFAPTGIGVVYGKSALLDALPPWQVGGGMIERVTFESTEYTKSPYKFEAGTGSISSVAGLGSALDYVSQVGLHHIAAHEQNLMAYAQQKLSQVPRLILIGNPTERVGAVPFIIEGIDTNKIGTYLDQHGIALRVGHHCAQPALHYFGLESMARPSFAFYNTYAEVDFLAKTLKKLVS